MKDHAHVYKLKGKRYICFVCKEEMDYDEALKLVEEKKLSMMTKGNDTLFEIV